MSHPLRCSMFAILVGVGLLAMGPIQGGENVKVDIRGNIKMINAVKGVKDLFGSILVEGPRSKQTPYDKASIRVTNQTKIYKLEGKERKAARFEDLKQGQLVEARFVGPVAESYPVQARAGEIVILPDR